MFQKKINQNANLNPNYKLYCLYHDKVFPEYYGDQIDKITFVKMDDGPYLYPALNHIYLQKEKWFHPIGKEWAEYEFYYSLYQGYKKGLIELPEYVGFIQYDMEFISRDNKNRTVNVIEFIGNLIKQKKIDEGTIISFQPYLFEKMYKQYYIMNPNNPQILIDDNYENCLETIIRECNEYTGQSKELFEFTNKILGMCGAVYLHKNIFIKVLDFLSVIIEDKRLSIYNKENRIQGGMLERYFAIFLHYLNVKIIEFSLLHYYGAGNKQQKDS